MFALRWPVPRGFPALRPRAPRASLATAGEWRSRFLAHGLHEEARPERLRSDGDAKVAMVSNPALRGKPTVSGRWSVRQMADPEGVSKATAQRWLSLFGVKPHSPKMFKLSRDPFFVADPASSVRWSFFAKRTRCPSDSTCGHGSGSESGSCWPELQVNSHWRKRFKKEAVGSAGRSSPRLITPTQSTSRSHSSISADACRCGG